MREDLDRESTIGGTTSDNGPQVSDNESPLWGIRRPASGPRLSVLLYQPEIPQNTGNIARTCAATHTPLYMVEPLGFHITDKLLKRAGLDYWPYVRMRLFSDFSAAIREIPHSRMIYFSTHASRFYYDFSFQPGDCLVFGPETRGLPQELLAKYPGDVVKIPN